MGSGSGDRAKTRLDRGTASGNHGLAVLTLPDESDDPAGTQS
jgi:hypothetical protein